MTINKVLYKIQQELKVPKAQYNSFGKYNYRSCEDIVEAVKKVLPEGYVLTLSDKVVQVGERYYVKATAMLKSDEGCYAKCHGYAREALSKKGMDESQITGTASTYARKYALNGMFAIDDTKDNDTDESRIEMEKRKEKADKEEAAKKQKYAEALRDKLLKMLNTVNSDERLKSFKNTQEIKDLRDKLFTLCVDMSSKIDEAITEKEKELVVELPANPIPSPSNLT